MSMETLLAQALKFGVGTRGIEAGSPTAGKAGEAGEPYCDFGSQSSLAFRTR